MSFSVQYITNYHEQTPWAKKMMPLLFFLCDIRLQEQVVNMRIYHTTHLSSEQLLEHPEMSGHLWSIPPTSHNLAAIVSVKLAPRHHRKGLEPTNLGGRFMVHVPMIPMASW